MLEKLVSPVIDTQPMLRELDPATVQRVVEGNLVKRMISEAQVASRKCEFYSGQCVDEEIVKFFKTEAKLIDRAAKSLEQYYENMTKEVKK